MGYPTQKEEITARGVGEAVRTAERMRDFRTSDKDVAKRRVRARDGASRRSVRNPEEAKEPRSGGEAGRTPGLLRGGRPPLDASACTENLKLPTGWRA